MTGVPEVLPDRRHGHTVGAAGRQCAHVPSALLLPVLTCAAVLLASGLVKLRDPASVDRAFTALGCPPPSTRRSCGRLVPWVEVALGTWLLLATGPAAVVVAR